MREILSDGENALLVAPGNPSALAQAIARLMEDHDLRSRLGRAARAAVAEYSWERRAERLEALFTDVLASTR